MGSRMSLVSSYDETQSVGPDSLDYRDVSRKIGRRVTPENWVVFFVAADAVLIALSCALAAGVLTDFAPPLGRGAVAGIALVYLALHGLFGRGLHAYDADRIFDLGHAVKASGKAFCFAFVVLLVVFAALNVDPAYSDVWFYWASGLALFSTTGLRLGVLASARARLREGDFVQKAVSASLFCDPLPDAEIDESTQYVVKIVKSLRLRDLSELPEMIDSLVNEEIDVVYLRTPWVDAPVALEQLSRLRCYSLKVFVVADDRRVTAHQLGVERLGDFISIAGVDRPLDRWGLWLKRAQDVVLSSLLILAASPVMALVALAIKLDSKGPVLFKQPRTGFNGQLFELWKFRSMYADKADYTAKTQTSKDDPRVTRVGRFIRKTSLDELPQFFNVLQGSMSIVGPRPHAVHTRTNGRTLEELADQYAARHRVKPGLTGLAQVSGYRGQLDTVEKVRKRVAFDIDYIENWSTWLDVKIMLRTAWLVLHDPTAF